VSAPPSNRLLNTRLLASGAVLAGAGGMLATAGLTLGSVAVLGAARRWQQRTEMTPAQLARHALGAATVATSSGVRAWRGPMPVPAPRSPMDPAADGVRTPVS
jgi:hypothetical protein